MSLDSHPTTPATGPDPLRFDGPDAFARWRRAISEAFVPLDAHPIGGGAPSFHGSLHCAALGSAMQLSEVSGTHVRVRRTAETIRKADPGFVKFGMQVSGNGILRQGDHEAPLSPGDFAVYDTRVPYELHFADDFTMFVVMLPRDALKISSGVLDAVVGRRIRGHDGVGALISPFLMQLRHNLQNGTLPSTPMFEDAVADLLSAAFDETAPPLRERSGPTLLASAKTFIDHHLSDPDLNTVMVATAHHISARYLQKLFETDGRTVASWIRSRRLDKCRRDLADPRLTQETIRTICARYGFLDTAHFSRLFKDTFGQSPSSFRGHALTETHPRPPEHTYI
ncbi:helix-turn-helix domain-containing protein [Rhodococcus opacus]|uniref:AraC-like ligand-binding domain-containing protein n=1 Tax=Rhodococcus opacus TaxID=37919 RepID=UPI001FF519DC|nr:helix-turn-helix domain-containing protein [Rhodococcus opacus]UOT03273.1 helix-turn-helix domain-containing protein [Rhodococcus opacus]